MHATKPAIILVFITYGICAAYGIIVSNKLSLYFASLSPTKIKKLLLLIKAQGVNLRICER